MAGEDYPRTLGELEDVFATEADCRAYLDRLRWGEDGAAFACPGCGHSERWLTDEYVSVCRACRRKTSVTAGTIFAGSRKPLRDWFRAGWLVTTQKSGFSAKALQRTLGIGGYQTAWTMLHKLRSAMVRPGRSKLSGDVEVDETLLGGKESADEGQGRKTTKKKRIIVAVELTPGEPGLGRIRMGLIDDFSALSFISFVRANVERGSVIHTDGHPSYGSLPDHGYEHRKIVLDSVDWEAGEVMPGVHRVIALFKRWWLGTHQGVMSKDHLVAYLDEFVFRFNRRTSRNPGMIFYRLMQYAVVTDPKSYVELTDHP